MYAASSSSAMYAGAPHPYRPGTPAEPCREELEQVECSPEQLTAYRDLVDRAVEARTHAYAPNSHSMVGSAILARDGKIFTGANFETTAYADHGEQVALARALAAGESPKDLIASATFVAREGGPTPEDFHKQANMTSCGNCRQAIFEINPDMHEVVLAADGEHVEVYRAGDLLPHAYHRDRVPVPNPAPTTSDNPDPLIAEALIARSRSYVPRTNEPVGAALQTGSGHIYTGIRMETSSFTTQPERMALDESLMAGERDIQRVVLVGGAGPEGEIPNRISWDSLQAIADVSPQATLTLGDGQGHYVDMPIADGPKYLLAHKK